MSTFELEEWMEREMSLRLELVKEVFRKRPQGWSADDIIEEATALELYILRGPKPGSPRSTSTEHSAVVDGLESTISPAHPEHPEEQQPERYVECASEDDARRLLLLIEKLHGPPYVTIHDDEYKWMLEDPYPEFEPVDCDPGWAKEVDQDLERQGYHPAAIEAIKRAAVRLERDFPLRKEVEDSGKFDFTTPCVEACFLEGRSLGHAWVRTPLARLLRKDELDALYAKHEERYSEAKRIYDSLDISEVCALSERE